MAGLLASDGRADEGASLAARLRALDQDAWALLYDEHQPRIWRYCYARTGSRDAADDLAAQVFAEALQSIHRYRYRGKPILAWLYRIASNHVGKWFRQASRGNSSGEWARPGELLDQRLASVTLGEALRALTADQREVLLLRYFGGYSTPEIAAAMKRSPTAVYSLEERALARMRSLVGERQEFLPALPAKPRTSRV